MYLLAVAMCSPNSYRSCTHLYTLILVFFLFIYKGFLYIKEIKPMSVIFVQLFFYSVMLKRDKSVAFETCTSLNFCIINLALLLWSFFLFGRFFKTTQMSESPFPFIYAILWFISTLEISRGERCRSTPVGYRNKSTNIANCSKCHQADPRRIYEGELTLVHICLKQSFPGPRRFP